MNLKATSPSGSIDANANVAHFGDETRSSCELLYVQIADTYNIAIASTSFVNLLDSTKNALLPFLTRASADDPLVALSCELEALSIHMSPSWVRQGFPVSYCMFGIHAHITLTLLQRALRFTRQHAKLAAAILQRDGHG